MLRFPRRTRSVGRIAVGLAALTVPFVGASAAQGAIGTTSPANTAAPDLVSGNVVAANFVQACFDQPVDVNDPDPGDIRVGGYKTNEDPDGPTNQGAWALGSAPVSLGNNCVRTQIGATDLEAYTIISVAAGTVRNEADVTTNLTDSAPLVGSDTQNGTRGNSTGPDLESVIVLGPENQIVYNFDQEVDCANAVAPLGGGPGLYHYVLQNGNEDEGETFQGCDGNQVVVDFDLPAPRGGPGPNVSQARSAWVERGGAFALHFPTLQNSNPLFSVDVAGGGITVRPDLRSAELQDPAGGSDQMVFTFDENVVGGNPGQFTAVYSDSPNEEVGDEIVNILNGNQVVVRFDELSERSEYVIGGSVGGVEINSVTRGSAECAVFAADNPEECNVDGGKPSGDNQNAFAIGWTTGPDAVSASVNQGAGLVRVIMDQRYEVNDEDCAQLVNSSGELFAGATSTTGFSSSIPNVVPVEFNFSQNELSQAVGLYIGGVPFQGGDFGDCGALFSPAFGGTPDVPSVSGAPEFYDNVDQVFSIR